LFIAALLAFSVQPLHAVERGGVVVAYSESMENLSLRANEPGAIGGPALSTLVFDAFGQRFELDLEPNNRLLADDGLNASDLGIYRGRLAGKPGSWARIVISNGLPSGLLWDGEEMLAIEAVSAEQGGPASASIYRLKDTYVEPGTMSCGTSGKKMNLATAYATVTGELDTALAQAAGAVDEIKIGIVSDFEFTSSNGSNVESEILARMNNVDGIFSEQLGVQLTVEVIETFPTSDDPFTTTVPGDLLRQLGNYREATPAQNSQGLTHMFTGRNLDGTTVGIAFTDALCRREFGVGLTQSSRSPATDSLVAAHEIGHNFGAEHDGEVGSVCASVTGDFLMSPRVSGTDQFSSCSIDTMRPRADAASCVNPLPQAGVSIALTSPPPNLLLGESTDLRFDVANTGSEDATNVAASFVLPTNITIDSVASTIGQCTSGGGQVDCTIGVIPVNGSARIALSVTASSVGSAQVDAAAVADGDANLDDNAQAVQVVVDAATNLRVVNAATGSAMLNGAVTIRPSIENNSSLPATNLTLTVSFSGGLRVDGASWADGTCSLGASSLTCQRSSLAAGSSVSLEIRLTATATGSQTYNGTVAASEVDANESDNRISGTIGVSGGSSGQAESGGGGAVNLFWMLLAAFFGRVARRRRP
jgi:hypothetical protein